MIDDLFGLSGEVAVVTGGASGMGAATARELASRGATLVLVDVREERMAIQVDRVAGQAQIYVKPVPELLVHVKALAGLTILGDGRPVFVLDLNQLA